MHRVLFVLELALHSLLEKELRFDHCLDFFSTMSQTGRRMKAAFAVSNKPKIQDTGCGVYAEVYFAKHCADIWNVPDKQMVVISRGRLFSGWVCSHPMPDCVLYIRPTPTNIMIREQGYISYDSSYQLLV